MSEMLVSVLDSTVNASVIKLESRKFPSLVIQGDTLHSWISSVRRLKKLSESALSVEDELIDDFNEIINLMENYLSHYELVLLENKFELPY